MAKSTKADETTAEETPQAQAAPVGEGLTIQDLNTALQIISVVQARGAIRAEEMVVVGALYNKLHSFLEASGALAQDQGAMPAADASKEPVGS